MIFVDGRAEQQDYSSSWCYDHAVSEIPLLFTSPLLAPQANSITTMG